MRKSCALHSRRDAVPTEVRGRILRELYRADRSLVVSREQIAFLLHAQCLIWVEKAPQID